VHAADAHVLPAVALVPYLPPVRLTGVHDNDLEPLTDLIEVGRLAPSLERTYALEQVPDAMRHLEAGTVRGKLAVTL
jgi:NADPH:quinone reductase-like Zn-dependent oxidoreductase